MVEVIPGLLLGSMGDVVVLLGHHHRTHHVNQLLSILTNPIDWSEIKTPQGSLMAKYISLPDLPSSDLLTHFPSCYQYIDDCIQDGGNVLVHCEHGVSRSSTVVLAYLMKKRKISFLKALTFVRDRKQDIRPNLGFQEQLKLWEMMNYQLDESCKSYRAYVLHHQAQAMKKNGYIESMQLSPNPTMSHIDKGVLYKCRKCRHILLSCESVLQHELGNGESAFTRNRHGNAAMNYFVINDTKKKQTESIKQENNDKQNNDIPNDRTPSITPPNTTNTVSVSGQDQGINIDTTMDDSSLPSTQSTTNEVLSELSALRNRVSSLRIEFPSDNDMCSSLFVEPVEWMGPLIIGHNDGKLLCPKCSSRIGSFDWSGGQCSCGKWVTPAFKIVKSKLDTVHAVRH